MTAVVGILNKHAIAIAADSAVTISGSNGNKIFNRANKIFTLSKHYPVGVMLYNSASFLGTPWETIIKVYRKQLGATCFKTVKEYQEDFIKFFHEKNFFSNQKTNEDFIQLFFIDILNTFINDSLKNHRHLVNNPSPENKAIILNLLEISAQALVDQLESQKDYFCPELTTYSFDEFLSQNKRSIEIATDHYFKNNDFELNDSLKTNLCNLLFLLLCSQEKTSNYTGLVFVGFGEDEIYPQLIPVNISLVVQNRLRYYVDSESETHISNDISSAIRPFAQQDVINTILTGIAPALDNTYLENFEATFSKYNETLLHILGDKAPELSAQIKALNIHELSKEYSRKNEETRYKNYIAPLMNAVDTLSKEDLAEMAESLIYLTYLKRRITFAEESVGGPVDVAIISKGDGFIWIKRKFYFKPELNKHFFDNYFKI